MFYEAKISAGQRNIQWSHEAEQIDWLINQFHHIKPKRASAIKFYYSEPGDIRRQAKVLGLPKSTYFERIQKGREWLGREFYQLHLIRSANQPLAKLLCYLDRLWTVSLENSIENGWFYEKSNDEDGTLLKFKAIYHDLLTKAPPFEKSIFDWCLLAAKKRVNAIVSNGYRGAYERAAVLTGACTEALKFIDAIGAVHFFNSIKKKYPRHTAFQRELKELAFVDNKQGVKISG